MVTHTQNLINDFISKCIVLDGTSCHYFTKTLSVYVSVCMYVCMYVYIYILVLCSIHKYDDVSSQRFDNTLAQFSWPCIDIVARLQQWAVLNLNTRTPFKMG